MLTKIFNNTYNFGELVIVDVLCRQLYNFQTLTLKDIFDIQ